jgi:hypothetical protein
LIARLVRMVVWFAVPLLAVLAAGIASAADSSLVKLASARFPNLTRAERTLLENTDVENDARTDFAVAGVSADSFDISNDPAHAANWDAQRNIRASLIRWLCVTPGAVAMVDPGGIRLLGARIVGGLDLSYVRIPFALVLNHCAIPERIHLHSADVPQLDLNGSYTGEIDGEGLNVHGELFLGYGFHASGEVVLQDAKIDGYIDCGAGHFSHSKVEPQVWGAGLNKALNLEAAQVRSDIYLWDGFESDGMIYLDDAVLGADLDMMGARVSNPGQAAILADGIDVKGNLLIGYRSVGENSSVARHFGKVSQGFQADGLVEFSAAHVGANFVVTHARFSDSTSATNGFVGQEMSIRSAFFWTDVILDKNAKLDISASAVNLFVDDKRSWPGPGNLFIDGLIYQGIVPSDVSPRLRWIGLQSGFHPQPYRQLAKVLHESGDDSGAIKVLVAAGDARYEQYGLMGRLVGGILRVTIGYGHQPFRTILWMMGVIILGWLLVTTGARAGVMRRTWPDSPPPGEVAVYEKLHPLLYSLDVFLPFVNLHQEHYWWPDAERTGGSSVLGVHIRVSGAFLRYYLWTQVIAGWLLSAVFVAGVTGLMRND